jgi:hypothetical protein
VHDRYDMNQHTRATSPQAARLTTEFAARFGILGPAEYCIGRLGELARLGIDRFVVVGPSLDSDRDQAIEAHQAFVRDVLPAARESASA